MTEEWTSDYQMPIPLQGACAVQYNGKILLLGGKNEKLSGEQDLFNFWLYLSPLSKLPDQTTTKGSSMYLLRNEDLGFSNLLREHSHMTSDF